MMLPNQLSFKTKLICLTAVVSLSACASFDITKNHPHFIDTKRGYARVYEAKKVAPKQCGDPDYAFVYTGKNVPLSEMNGYVAIPASEVQYDLRIYNEDLKRKANCPTNLVDEKAIMTEMQQAQ